MAKYKVGDIVRVILLDEVRREKRNWWGAHEFPSGVSFTTEMEHYCDMELPISEVIDRSDMPRYRLDGAGGWFFTDEMLEDVSGDPATSEEMDFTDLF